MLCGHHAALHTPASLLACQLGRADGAKRLGCGMRAGRSAAKPTLPFW